jgi:hypothetical protein
VGQDEPGGSTLPCGLRRTVWIGHSLRLRSGQALSDKCWLSCGSDTPVRQVVAVKLRRLQFKPHLVGRREPHRFVEAAAGITGM